MSHLKTSIEKGSLHPDFKGYSVKYAAIQNIYDQKTKTRHGIMVKAKGKGNKWALLGNESSPFWYESEQDAKNDLKLLKQWQKESGQ